MVDTMIRLHESNSTDFDAIGLCVLPDAMKCEVTEERNGVFELQMTYSIEGRDFSELMLRRFIVAKPNPFDDPQPFRIYEMSKPLNGIVTIKAEHLSYDLSGYSDKPFTASGVVAAMTRLKSYSVVSCPFNFSTDKSTTATMMVDKPTSIRSLLGGTKGSVLDVYGGGEYEFDRYNVKLWAARGENRGVSIRYGKNLTSLQQEENCANVYSHIYPYYYSDEDGLVSLSGYTVAVPGTHNYTKILPVDLSDKFEEPPTQAQLLTEANKYIQTNNLQSPKVNLSVSFVQLAQSEEYKNYALLETVHLCDTVNVEFPKLGVSSTAKCIKTVFNVLTGKYTSIELGDARTNLATAMANQTDNLAEDVAESSVFKQAVMHATKLITGGLGGYVVLHSSSGGNQPDEILVMDQPTVEAATNVWRWNKNGLGHSKTGYNGPFGLAMTYDGQIVADRITTGTLNASLVKTGVLQDYAGKNYWNMQTGEFRLAATTTIGGSTVSSIASSAASSAVNAQTQQSIFNKLTNNGQTQGIYLSGGKLYLNATYMNTGTLSANLITAGTMSAARIHGGTYKVGGAGNGNGVLEIYNNSDVRVGRWDRDALYVGNIASSLSSPNTKIANGGAITTKSLTANDYVYVDGNSSSLVRVPYSSNTSYYSELSTTGFNARGAYGGSIFTASINPGSKGFGVQVNSNSGGNYGSLHVNGNEPRLALYRNGTIMYTVMLDKNDLVFYTTRSTGSDSETVEDYTYYGRRGYVVDSSYGTKSALVRTKDYLNRLLYCYETPSPMFGDVGEGQIAEDGKCFIVIDSAFAETVNLNQYQVFLQNYGSGESYISSKNSTYFVVEGTPGLNFGWELKAKQKDNDQLRLDYFNVPLDISNDKEYGNMLQTHIEEIKSQREVA